MYVDVDMDMDGGYPSWCSTSVPPPLEAGGKPGEDMVNFVGRCGAAWAATHEGDTSACSRLWYECSTTLQLANAELILSALGA